MSDTIASITLEEGRVLRRKAEIEQERAQAIDDLLKENVFRPDGMGPGPYDLNLSIRDNRLLIGLSTKDGEKSEVTLPVSPFKSIVRDYFLICENYFEAAKTSDPFRMEAIDMSRRAVHDEGSGLMQRTLEGKITVDFETARRLFTLLCVLHIR